MATLTREPTVPIGVRFGACLWERIDSEAGASGLTRSRWLREAVEHGLSSTDLFEAELAGDDVADLLAGKRRSVVRLTPSLLQQLDAVAAREGVTRTLLLALVALRRMHHETHRWRFNTL
jgi:predicted DNA-binding protein